MSSPSTPVYASASADHLLLTPPGSTAASGNPLDARTGVAALGVLESRNTWAAAGGLEQPATAAGGGGALRSSDAHTHSMAGSSGSAPAYYEEAVEAELLRSVCCRPGYRGQASDLIASASGDRSLASGNPLPGPMLPAGYRFPSSFAASGRVEHAGRGGASAIGGGSMGSGVQMGYHHVESLAAAAGGSPSLVLASVDRSLASSNTNPRAAFPVSYGSSSSSLGAPKLASGSGSPFAAGSWGPHPGVQAGYHHGGLEAAAAAGTSHITVAKESDSGSPKAASPAPAPAQKPSYAQRAFQALASVVNYIKSTVVSIWNFFFSRASS